MQHFMEDYFLNVLRRGTPERNALRCLCLSIVCCRPRAIWPQAVLHLTPAMPLGRQVQFDLRTCQWVRLDGLDMSLHLVEKISNHVCSDWPTYASVNVAFKSVSVRSPARATFDAVLRDLLAWRAGQFGREPQPRSLSIWTISWPDNGGSRIARAGDTSVGRLSIGDAADEATD